MAKHKNYQDYVIKDGRLVGEFDEMYKDFSDPWEQSTRECEAPEKEEILKFLKRHKIQRVLELGCGLGYFSNRISQVSPNVLGVDIASTAVEKASKKFPHCDFKQGSVSDHALILSKQPEAIVMAEITWYILSELDAFLGFLKTNLKGTYLLHSLNTYPEGVQQYGKDYFSDLKSIKDYMKLDYLESASFDFHDGCTRTYFAAQL